MPPETITLVRHGESCGNLDKNTFLTITDDRMDLTPQGESQAKAAIPLIREAIGDEPALFYTSPYLRCRRTTEIIRAGFRKEQVSLIEDNHLRERKIGNLIGVEEIATIGAEFRGQGFFYRPPNGESAAEVFTRAELFRAAMKSRWNAPGHPRHVVIISHNTTLKTFLMAELLIRAAYFSDLGTIGNCQVITLRSKESAFGLQYVPCELPIDITEAQINSTLS